MPKTKSHRIARKPLSVLFSAGLLGMAASLASSPLVHAQGQPVEAEQKSYRIPAGALKQSLNRFASEAGITLSFEPALVEGKAAPALNGSFTPTQGLETLLRDSDLVVVPESGGGYRIQAMSGNGDGEGPLRLSPINVEGASGLSGDAYAVPLATTGAKRPLSKLETPASVQTVSRAVIDDQQAETVEQALRNVSGTVFLDGGEGTAIFSRGQSATTFQDGFLLTGFTGGDLSRSQLDTYNIERIEVFKGPASVLYGRGNGGGIINLITRKPLAEPEYRVGLRLDDEGGVRSSVDLTGPMTVDGSVRYRVNAIYEDGNSHRDKVDSDDYAVAPSIAWDVAEDTSVLVQTEFVDFEQTPDGGVPGEDGDLFPGVSPDDFFGELDDKRNIERETVKITVNHNFDGPWSWKNAIRWESDDSLTEFARPDGIGEDGRTATRSSITNGFEREGYRWLSELNGAFATGGITHDLLVGLELGRRDNDVLFAGGPIDGIDIFNPVFGAEPGEPFFTFVSDSERDLAGVFVQDRLKLSEAWTLSVGGRYDYVDQTIENGLVGNTSKQPEKEDEEFSPNVGVVFQPADTYSFYANWSQSFQPVNGALSDADGEILDPETAELFEIGAKLELANGRFTGTAALYRIDREDAAEPVPDLAGVQDNLGEVRSEGFELDIKGEVLPGWNLLAAYAYTDATIEANPDPALVGNQVNEIPEHSGRLWTTYEISSGPLDGLGVNGGVTYVDSRPATDANEAELPSYSTVDLGVFYDQPGYKIQLNIRNLFDEDDNILGRKRGSFLRVGEPLSARLSFELRF